LKVLVACEFSGVVRKAFRELGHDAWSCDLLPDKSEQDFPGGGTYRSLFHIQGDVIPHLDEGWDLMIAHPPCTRLANSGNRWRKGKEKEEEEAVQFVQLLMDAPIPRIAIENPIGILSTRIRKPDQIVQPWMFGDEATKTTCLWLKNLPLLIPTNIVSKGERHITKSGKSLPKWYNLPPSPDRAALRSITFPGFAAAMAAQWSNLND
jgi:hypothetical protein